MILVYYGFDHPLKKKTKVYCNLIFLIVLKIFLYYKDLKIFYTNNVINYTLNRIQNNFFW